MHRPRGAVRAQQSNHRLLCSTPLGYAAKFGQIAMVEFLLARGARPSLPDDPPWATPLEWAARRGHDKIVRLLR